MINLYMISRSILFFVVFASSFSILHGQDTIYNDRETKTYKIQSGTIIKVTDVTQDPGSTNLSGIFFGAFGPEGFNNVGIYHMNMQRKFYIEAVAGPTGGQVDANIFFRRKYKSFEVTQSIASTHTGYRTILKEQITLPGTKIISSGIHFGTNTTDYSKGKFNYNPLVSYGIVLGYSAFIFKGAKWKIERSDGVMSYFMRGGMFNRFTLDMMYYYKTVKLSSKANGIPNTLGFRIYWDGCATSWSSTRAAISIHYMFGFGVNANDKVEIPIIGGAGIGISF